MKKEITSYTAAQAALSHILDAARAAFMRYDYRCPLTLQYEVSDDGEKVTIEISEPQEKTKIICNNAEA